MTEIEPLAEAVSAETALVAPPISERARFTRFLVTGGLAAGVYEIAEVKKAPIAVEAVTRIDAIFAIERTINARTPAEQQAVRDQTIKPRVEDLVTWLNEQRRALSSKSETAKAMDYGLKRMGVEIVMLASV